MKSYYMLLASLPPLPSRFDAGPIPITARTLHHRLALLEEKDREVIAQLSDFFRWDRQPLDRTDAEVLSKHRSLSEEIQNSLVQRLVHHRFEMRTIVAATRCRRAGLPPPELPNLPIAESIRRYWDQPYFRLSTQFPWLPRFCKALDDEQPQQAQHQLFDDLWNLWTRLSQQYHFSFESIVLYLARWEILDRWASQNAEVGKQRFDDLVEGILSQGRGIGVEPVVP